MSKSATITALLQRLQRFGTSVELSWGEDDGLWGVVWLSGGYRYSAAHADLVEALSEVWVTAAAAYGQEKDHAPA